jgi:hypothetical protein
MNPPINSPENLDFTQERFNKEHNHDGINSAKIPSGGSNISYGTSLPTASENAYKFYYLTTTDTLYISNGISWIALN